MSALESLPGGAGTVKSVLADFYDRVFADVMIGFFFRDSDKQRLIDKETELIVGALGGDAEYTGEPLRDVHARHPILGVHFLRRLQLLKETLADHHVPAAVMACDRSGGYTSCLPSGRAGAPPGKL